jgi:hypothetical protein
MGNQNAGGSAASDVIPIFPRLVWEIDLEAQSREAIGARVLAALAHQRDHPATGCGRAHTRWRARGNERTRRPVALQIASVTSAVVMTAKARIERCVA